MGESGDGRRETTNIGDRGGDREVGCWVETNYYRIADDAMLGRAERTGLGQDEVWHGLAIRHAQDQPPPRCGDYGPSVWTQTERRFKRATLGGWYCPWGE